MKIFRFNSHLLIMLALLIFSSCKDDTTSPTNEFSAKFAVISDLHYFSTTLGTSGAAFQQYLAQDRKLIAESKEINMSLLNSLKQEDVNFILVPGDLTKDGEKVSHQEIAQLFREVESTGKKVYVIPGNHDVNNPHAVSYIGETTARVDNVTSSDFASIYNEFGYGEAIAKDPNSLSYVASPEEGLWLIAMDACQYDNNVDSPITGGKFKDETLAWVKEQLQKAKESNKKVIGMIHHGMVEHFTGQKTNAISSEYVIDNWETVSNELASLGMKVVFTGHYHANDITKYTNGNNYIYDIETGSAVTAPCPYRIINYSSDKMDIKTKHVENVSNVNTNGQSFQDFAKNYLKTGMEAIVAYLLETEYGASKEQAAMASPYVTSAFMAHYAGDEVIPADVQAMANLLINSGDESSKNLGQSILSIYTDLNPSDNNVIIELK